MHMWMWIAYPCRRCRSEVVLISEERFDGAGGLLAQLDVLDEVGGRPLRQLVAPLGGQRRLAVRRCGRRRARWRRGEDGDARHGEEDGQDGGGPDGNLAQGRRERPVHLARLAQQRHGRTLKKTLPQVYKYVRNASRNASPSVAPHQAAQRRLDANQKDKPCPPCIPRLATNEPSRGKSLVNLQ